MEYREIGTTGIKISIVGFGGMRISGVSDEEALATINKAYESNINFYETGFSYGKGKSEQLIGKALCNKRDNVVLANKTGTFITDDIQEIRRSLETSLINEQTDHFDLYSFWGVNNLKQFSLAMRPGIFDSLLKFKEEGKIRAIGITTHAQPEEIIKFVEQLPLDCITLKNNVLNRRMENTIDILRKKKIGVIIMTPLAGGMIADPGEEIKKEMEKHNIHPAVLGLRYLTSNPGITSVISGMCHPQEVGLNIQAGISQPLSDNEKKMIEYIQQRLSGLGEKFCTGCMYCQPCPSGVGIASVFKLWNVLRGYGNAAYSRVEYSKMKNETHWADFRGKWAEACTECGLCEKKCPEKLSIRNDLKKAHETLTKDI